MLGLVIYLVVLIGLWLLVVGYITRSPHFDDPEPGDWRLVEHTREDAS